MRPSSTAALLLLAGCVTAPPLRPADPAQAVANERSAAIAAAEGVRFVVRPGGWRGSSEYVEEYLTPVEVAIENASGRPLQIRPSHFSLLASDGLRYDALSREDVRRALGPFRGGGGYGYGSYYYPRYGWPGAFHPWGGPYAWGGGFWPRPWGVPYGYSGGGLPARALAQGTLDAGGRASVVVFFPVPATSLSALELHADLVDTSGQKFGELRVPFVREGQQPEVVPLPPTAAPPPEAPRPGATAPAPPSS